MFRGQILVVFAVAVLCAFGLGYYLGGDGSSQNTQNTGLNIEETSISSWYEQPEEDLLISELDAPKFLFDCSSQSNYEIFLTSRNYTATGHDGMLENSELTKNIYAFGWSVDGSALAVNLNNNAYSLSWEVYDVIEDRSKKAVGGYYEGGCQEFENSVRDLFENYKIVDAGSQFHHSNKIEWGGDTYELRIENGILSVFANDGEKEVSKRIANTEGEVLGFFKSPVQKRIAVLVGSMEQGFEMESEYITTLYGCLLKHADFN